MKYIPLQVSQYYFQKKIRPKTKNRSSSSSSSQYQFYYWIVCLLLCAYSLQQCPSPLTNRYRRWQSIVCETIRLFQDYGYQLYDLEQQQPNQQSSSLRYDIWVNYMVPACIHVIQQLPTKEETFIYHVGVFAGMIGTSSTIVELECQRISDLLKSSSNMEHDVRFVAMHYTVQSICNAFSHFDDYTSSELTIWLNPHRPLSESIVESPDDDDIEFLMNQNDLSWWINKASCQLNTSGQEKVAHMTTDWNDLGLSLLAHTAFIGRPLPYDPSFVWYVWFPHVTILFKKVGDYPKLLSNIPLTFLESLLQVVPDQSLTLDIENPNDESFHERPDAPLEVFQLLSDQMISYGSRISSVDDELRYKKHVEYIAGLVTSLMNRYRPVSQVQIVEKLIHDCPNPGLQARFLDLIRPILFDDSCEKEVWKLLNKLIKDLFKYISNEDNSNLLIAVDDLISNLELYVSAITMVQRWMMVRGGGTIPAEMGGIRVSLKGFQDALQNTLEKWSTDSF